MIETPKYKDISGQKFSRAQAVEYSGNDKDGRALWLCLCDCGNKFVASGRGLRNGAIQSCGCLQKEIKTARFLEHKGENAYSYKHGGSNERLFFVWTSMKSRCYNPAHHAYHRYGGRGITVCDEWKTDYSAFREWAMRNGYDENAKRGECTIDRINNDGNYEPGNCRFVDNLEQSHNRRPYPKNRKSRKNNTRRI